jgi:predicted RNA-binding Zn-ribbon protein involved in translation (DUF1610 family)
MTVSTRTPEGWSGRCTTCGNKLRVEPSATGHDATCPRCGALVWLHPPHRLGHAWVAGRLAVQPVRAVGVRGVAGVSPSPDFPACATHAYMLVVEEVNARKT